MIFREDTLPCPFCGSSVIIKEAPPCHEGKHGKLRYMLTCSWCPCVFYSSPYYNSVDEAVEAWNRRIR